MIDQKIVNELMESPTFAEFIAHLNEESFKLNDLSTIEGKDDHEIALKVLARKDAYVILLDILSPFLDKQEMGSKFNKEEFIV